MAKVTLVFAILLILLGLIGFLGTGSTHFTALIPTWIGLVLGVCGKLAMSPIESRRKLFMHINVTLGLIGFVGTLAEMFRSLASSKPVDVTALEAKTVLAWLLLIYIALCVRSFTLARGSGKL